MRPIVVYQQTTVMRSVITHACNMTALVNQQDAPTELTGGALSNDAADRTGPGYEEVALQGHVFSALMA